MGSGDDKSWKAELLFDRLRGRSIQTGGDRTNHLQMTLFSQQTECLFDCC